MDDLIHLDKFNHDCSRDLQVNIADLNKIRSQNLDFFLVLDLEGKVEILEFPVLKINAKTLNVEDVFHRFSSPTLYHGAVWNNLFLSLYKTTYSNK
jgi:hypothetical protein